MKKQESLAGSKMIAAAAAGAGGSVLASLALCALAAKLLSLEVTSDSSVDMMVVGIVILASAIGSLTASCVCTNRRLPVCIATGMVYYLLLIVCNIMLFDGAFHALGGTAIAVLGGSGAVALMGLKGERRGGYRHRSRKSNWKVVQNSQRGN